MRVGRAAVSTRHANVIVNEGSDNANDILTLIERMKRRVLDAYGVVLREEVVRFDRQSSDPLRTDVR
jgi:UDP-N-acetylenolpyruvoylglucosamine reductase